MGGVRSPVREAARWRLVGLLFERPRPTWRAEVLGLAGEVRDERLAAAAKAAAGMTGEGAYLAVLGPGGAVSPREVAYRPMGDPGRILADLRGVYDAYGYAPRTEDPPDHVAVEIGFIGFLKLKQAYALTRQDRAGSRAAGVALERFVEEHPAGFAAELARRLGHVAFEPLRLAAAILADAFPATRSGAGPLALAPRAPAEDDDDWGCAAHFSG